MPTWQVRITLEPPRERSATFRPTGQMERVSRVVEKSPGLTKNGVRGLVSGRNNVKDAALDLLIGEGYIDRKPEGQAFKHFSVKPYREAEGRAT